MEGGTIGGFTIEDFQLKGLLNATTPVVILDSGQSANFSFDGNDASGIAIGGKATARNLGGENEFRGGDGILPINQSKNTNPLFKAFLSSAGEAGHKINEDMNGEDQEGFGMYDVTIHKGQRASVSKYYLNPCLLYTSPSPRD